MIFAVACKVRHEGVTFRPVACHSADSHRISNKLQWCHGEVLPPSVLKSMIDRRGSWCDVALFTLDITKLKSCSYQ